MPEAQYRFMKENKNITRAIIEATVDRGLREVDEDPQRSIRKLIDMAKQFSNGRFISEIYSIFQDLLRNEESPYYSAIEHVLHHTDRKALEDFGINLGYNSFTRGGKMIRHIEETSSYMVPWAIGIDIDPSRENVYSASFIDGLISQGIDLGIFTYAVTFKKRMTRIQDYLPLFRSHPGCAFMAILPDEELDNMTADGLKECTNVLSFIKGSGDYIDSNALSLRRRKAWYGTYDYYNESNCSQILSPVNCRKSISAEASFVMMIAEPGTSLECIRKTQKAIKEERLSPSCPLFIFDKYGDALQLKSILSSGSCFFEITDDRQIRTDRGVCPLPEGEPDLKQLFETCLKK